MKKFVLKRLLWMIPTVLGVCILTFTIMYFAPGDPASIILGTTATDAQLEELRESMGLNQPYLIRLGSYLSQVFLHFDFGTSYTTGVSVVSELMERLPRTLFLGVLSIVVSVVLGIPIGIYAATHQNKASDYISMTIALLGSAIPGFWFALVLVLIFSYRLNWFPAYGIGGISYWILPIVSNSFMAVGLQARQARSSMLEVIHSDYIVMAKAKGVQQRDVIYKHALPNALIPMITTAGSQFANSLAGGLLVEKIFSIPGVGNYLVNAVNNRDYPVVQGSIIILAISFSIIMLLTDLVMAAVDPNIKSQFAGSSKRKKK
ncbi:MAG: ABC transporter permease [Clostridiales bacterium]|nr:ABC transporter permease [Clostridiales bacterium]